MYKKEIIIILNVILMSIIILVRIITKNIELMKYDIQQKDIILKMWV